MAATTVRSDIAAASDIEVLTVGRASVDIYPQQTGPLSTVSTFAKFLGGTATNVAVGLAQLGRRTAVLTKVGRDGFGDFVRRALSEFGVETRFVGVAPGLLTPVTFCELDPPEDPTLVFYRMPEASDLELTDSDVPWPLVESVPVLWVTGTGVSAEPARTTQHAMLVTRGRPSPGSGRHTVLDLDWRSAFWQSMDDARDEYLRMLPHVSVAIGNRSEFEVAVGTSDPEKAAARILDHGVGIAFVKLGEAGAFVATRQGSTVVPPHSVNVMCGLGAGDAFGAAVVDALLAGANPVTAAIRGNAAGAIVASRLACADAMPVADEVDALLRGTYDHLDVVGSP